MSEDSPSNPSESLLPDFTPIWNRQRWKMVIHNLYCLQRGFSKLNQSIHLSQAHSLRCRPPLLPKWQTLQYPWTLTRANVNQKLAPATTAMKKGTFHDTAQNLGSSRFG